ncbi:response regulator [Candidatus Zixiibacteriota bacterium]
MKKIRLLMVDDEEEFLVSSSLALNRRGFDVAVAPNGVTALEMVERREFDVVVLDVKMPDIDGIQVFKEIHQKFPGLPVILLTGYGSLSDAFQTSKEGIADYLFKPIEMDDLARSIHRAAENAQHKTVRDHLREAEPKFAESIHVMLVDDEVQFLDSMKRVLQRRNMEISTAKSGNEALELLLESLVDVVVLDLKMPGMDGLEVLRRIKIGFPSVEVIVLTGHPSVETALEVINLGANEYLKKPPEIDDLVTAIRKLYDERQHAMTERQQKLIEEIRRRYPD